ncbi:MAG: protein kinase [Acidobacteriota bacterium]|nr:MAG: protein kinase [Acidobacteriota bacterium]
MRSAPNLSALTKPGAILALVIGRQLAHYKIVDRLGVGGMGEVFLAEDTRLGRRVALKMLRPERGLDEQRRARFEREARTIAALQHPHIVTIYAVEEDDGVLFLTMEYIEGQKLSSLIPEGGLPLERFFALAMPLIEAVAAAHERGIVHRDLKPDNVMVDGEGRVKVLDFGLAKLAEATTSESAETRAPELTATMERAIVGTAAYMSPEQAQGQSVDARSDVFSIGVLLYQMLTGRPPFEGETTLSILSSILKDTPDTVSDIRHELPPALGSVIARCLAKDSGERFPDARALQREIEAVQQRLEGRRRSPASGARRGWLIAALLLIGAVVTAWAVWPPARAPATRAPGAAIGASGRPSIAVLSFEDHSGSEELRWLASGLPSMLLTGLAQTPGLDVVSRQRIQDILRQLGSEQVEAIDQRLREEIAERSGAGAVVVGSIFKSGEEIRIDVQVEDVGSGRVITAESVRGQDVFPMVDELTRRIRRSLPRLPRIGAAPSRGLAEVTTSSLEAYRLYSEGLEALHNHRMSEARELMRRAVEVDPQFGMAYFYLWTVSETLRDMTSAEAYRIRALENVERLPERNRLLVEGAAAYQEGRIDEAITTLERLIERYPDELDAYIRLSLVHLFNGNDDAYLDVLRRGVEAIPASGTAHNFYGYALLRSGRYTEGLRALEQYARLSPGEPNPLDSLAEAYLLTGQPEKALARYAQVLALDASFENAHAGRAWAFGMLGRFEEALEELAAQKSVLERESLPLTEHHMFRAVVLSRGGRYEEASAALDDGLSEAEQYDDLPMVAALYALRGMLERERGEPRAALEALERARRAAENVNGDVIRRGSLQFLERARAIVRVRERMPGAPAQPLARDEEQLVPGNPSAACVNAEIFLATGNVTAAREAISRCEPSLKAQFNVAVLGPTLLTNSPLTRDLGARLAIAEGDPKHAAEIYRTLNNPDIAAKWTAVLEPRFVLAEARLWAQLGDEPAARAAYARFAELWKSADPELPELEEARDYLSQPSD